jgi:hypothetical protein
MAEISFLSVGIPAVSSLVGAIIGSAITHLLTVRRDRDQRRREFKLKYLIEAWKNLEIGSRNETDVHRKSEVLEKAVADIQLFGSPGQIEMADTWARDMVNKQKGDTTPLLKNLQDSLRQELGLPKSPRFFLFRLTPLDKLQKVSGQGNLK